MCKRNLSLSSHPDFLFHLQREHNVFWRFKHPMNDVPVLKVLWPIRLKEDALTEPISCSNSALTATAYTFCCAVHLRCSVVIDEYFQQIQLLVH